MASERYLTYKYQDETSIASLIYRIFLKMHIKGLRVLFLPEFVVDMALSVLGLSVFHFWMVVFLALNPVGSISQLIGFAGASCHMLLIQHSQ